MRHFNVTIVLLHIFEAFQVQRQNHWKLLDSHSFLRLLIATAIVALELVIAAQRLRIAEASQTMCDAGVLIDVHLKVEKVLVFAADRFAVQAARFTG